MIDSIMQYFDHAYLGVLWVGTWAMGDKKIWSWYLKVIGSICGIIYGIYLVLNSNTGSGIILWNILFLVPIFRGLYLWRKHELASKNEPVLPRVLQDNEAL